MKRDIIQITNPIYAIPKEKTWYQYYNDIFVSVLPSCNIRPYIRRKSESSNALRKNDNPMCFWHSDWQYNKIEATYGLSKMNKRTYEISITYKNEIHRIDSLVERTAIEFQHTLDVSIREMNSRFLAHKAFGYYPILVLDFTFVCLSELTILNLKNIDKIKSWPNPDSNIAKFVNRLKKWISSEYYKNGHLIIDFKDVMAQFIPKLSHGFIVYKREEFINNVSNLSEYISNEIEEDKIRIIREKEEEERQQQIQEKERIDNWKIQNQIKINQNKIDLEKSPDYEYYRRVLMEKCIKSKIDNALFSCGPINFVSYKYKRSIKGSVIRKHHIYELFQEVYNNESELLIEYTTVGKMDKDNKYEYLFAEIVLQREFDRGLRTFFFVKKKGKSATRHIVRYEIIEDFLHSTTSPALTVYDEEGQLVSSDYYLFNIKIDNKEEWNVLSNFFDQFGYGDENELNKYRKTIEKIEASDKWNFIQYYCQNDRIPSYIRDQYFKYQSEKYSGNYE